MLIDYCKLLVLQVRRLVRRRRCTLNLKRGIARRETKPFTLLFVHNAIVAPAPHIPLAVLCSHNSTARMVFLEFLWNIRTIIADPKAAVKGIGGAGIRLGPRSSQFHSVKYDWKL